MIFIFPFQNIFLGLAYLLKLVGPGRDKSPPVFFQKQTCICTYIYIDEKHTTYIVFICIIKQENIIFIPDTGVGLDKPRDDIVAFALYPTIVVEMPAAPPTTRVQYPTLYVAFKQVRP